MLSKNEIERSIESLQPAPENETIAQCGVRVAHWLLTTIANEHPQIAVTVSLYARTISGDVVSPDEWHNNIEALELELDLAVARARARAVARARALALDIDLDLAIALARARARALDIDIARAIARALDLDLDLDLATIKILGERLNPVPQLDAKILEAIDGGGRLQMDLWHSCQTTHCRAGWAITLHAQGEELEFVFGSEWAGRIIYLASTGRVPNFFASDAAALDDIKKCARSQK